MFMSYLDLLNAVDKDGELISPSNVSSNRSFETKELTNVQIMLDPFEQFLLNDDEVKYYEKELQWYLDTYEKPVHHPIELTHDKWEKNPVPKADTFHADLRKMAEDVLGATNRCGPNSNYGEMCLRLKNHVGVTQLRWCVEKLKKDARTRQAIAFYNSPNYQFFSNADFVCCLSQLFNVKDGKLNAVVNSRSNDLINSFRFDSIWWRLFQMIVLDNLKDTYPDLKLGYVFVNFFSAHFYLKDTFKIDQLCSNALLSIELGKVLADYRENTDRR